MSIVNYMYPEWHPVPCNTPIRAYLVCSHPYLYHRKYRPPPQTKRHTKTNATQNFCETGEILFENECFTFTRKLSKTKHTITNNEFRKHIKRCDNRRNVDKYLNITVVMKYLSQVSHLKPVFAFPGGHEVNQFYSTCRNRESIKFKNLFYIPETIRRNKPIWYDIYECRFYMSNYHCFINGKTHSYETRSIYRLMQGKPFYFGYSDSITQFYQYDLMLDPKLEELLILQNTNNAMNTFYVIKSRLQDVNFKSNYSTYRCISNEYISLIVLHDGIDDCNSGDDETDPILCHHNGQMRNSSFCKISCRRPKCICPDLYFQKLKGGCSPYNINVKHNISDRKINFIDNGTKVHHTNIHHVYTDTFVIEEKKIEKIQVFQGSEYQFQSDCTEKELQDLRDIHSSYLVKACSGVNELQCTYSCAKCFPIHKLCVYELESNWNLKYCPSGAHLKNCERIECNKMFKCTNHYCLPYK